MSKTKEFIIAVFFFVLGFVFVHNIAKAEEVKCFGNAEFMKLIDEMNLVTLYNTRKGNEIREVLFSKDRRVYVVDYEKSDGDSTKAKSYCLVSVGEDAMFNETAIDYLYNIIEKAKGQKT